MIDYATGADVFVADFGVAHLSVRQADIEAARRDERARIFRLQRIVAGFFGEIDGVERVLVSVGIFSPAIADDQQDGFQR